MLLLFFLLSVPLTAPYFSKSGELSVIQGNEMLFNHFRSVPYGRSF